MIKDLQAVQNTGIEVDIEVSCDTYKTEINEILGQVKSVNKKQPYLISSTEKLVICKDVLKSSGASEFYNVKNGIYAGYSDTSTKTIYVSVQNYIEDTVEHEMFHQFDASFGDANLSDSEEFYELANNSYASIQSIFNYNRYQTMNIHEFFVAVALDYADDLEGPVLKKNFPDIYKYIDKYVSKRIEEGR